MTMSLSKSFRTVLTAVCLAAALTACTSSHEETSGTDAVQSAEARAQELIPQLTLEEKAALVQFNSQPVERLGIRGYNWWSEALHGVARNGSATVFPQPIGMAASFRPWRMGGCFSIRALLSGLRI